MNNYIKILLIEDNPGDARLIEEILKDARNIRVDFHWQESLQAGIDILSKEPFDVILLDLGLPDSHGLSSLRRIRKLKEQLPVIILTGLNDEDVGLNALGQGAQDYIVKGSLGIEAIERVIRYAIERKRSETELNKAIIEEERLNVLLEMAGAKAHEMNQPLSRLLANLELLEKPQGNHLERETSFQEIKQAGKQIAQMVKNIEALRHDDVPKSRQSNTAPVHFNQAVNTLVLESSDTDFASIVAMLKHFQQISLSRAKDIRSAIEIAKTRKFDVIIIEHALPDGTAFDFMKIAETEGIDTPVIILTGHGDEMVASRLIKAGAYDYLSKKKIDSESLARAIRTTLDKSGLRKEVEKAHRKMAEMSTTDALTGLYNRRYLSESLKYEITRAGRYKTGLSLCMIDIDHFKHVNDTWGHSTGDQVLKEISRILRETVRETDIPCRYGGEEFAVILPHTKSAGAQIFAERLRKRIAAHVFKASDIIFFVTVSCGIFSFNHDSDVSSENILEQADKALYQAKKRGRNRVVMAA